MKPQAQSLLYLQDDLRSRDCCFARSTKRLGSLDWPDLIVGWSIVSNLESQKYFDLEPKTLEFKLWAARLPSVTWPLFSRSTIIKRFDGLLRVLVEVSQASQNLPNFSNWNQRACKVCFAWKLTFGHVPTVALQDQRTGSDLWAGLIGLSYFYKKQVRISKFFRFGAEEFGVQRLASVTWPILFYETRMFGVK